MKKVVKLYADWCGPCKVLERMMRDLDIKHENVNIDLYLYIINYTILH